MSTRSQQEDQKEIRVSTDCSEDGEPFIGHYDSAPCFMKQNDHIHSGYRINFQTKWKLFKTLFMVHNQSVNIWTHLLPFLVLLVVLMSFSQLVDEVDFKKTVEESRLKLDIAYRQYEQLISNVSLNSSAVYHQKNQTCPLPQYSHEWSLFEKYQEMVEKMSAQANQLRDIVSQDIEGLGVQLKQQIELKLNKLNEYKKHYEKHIMPGIVQAIDRGINNTLVQKIRIHASSLKHYLDSQLFQMIELHPQAPNPELVSRWPLFVFISTAILCLLFSTIFHLFYPLSRNTFGLLLRFDFAGISLLIAGSAYPTFYYSMYCQFTAMQFYLTATSIIAFICFVIGLFQWVHLKKNAKYRAVIFGSFGLSMAVPLSHLVISEFYFNNFGDPYRFSDSYFYYFALISSYLIGLYIFIVKWPESKNPGKYDTCGHSHNIWHCLVVAGIIFTYYGCLNCYELRKEAACPIA